VGGQRSQRKRWIHCFEYVTAVIFVAAMSEYDQVLVEDGTTNRVVEALNLFGEVANSTWFEKTSIILFLNKSDLLEEKLPKYPFKASFPDYVGDNSFDNVSKHILKLFVDRNRHSDKKQIYSHFTCATDTQTIARVFDAITDIVLRESLNESGMMID